MDTDVELRNAIADTITRFFKNHNDPRIVYHGLQHTRSVVSRSEEIAQVYFLSARDYFVIFAAAWFHDTGHLVQVAEGHEAKSALLMRAYFQQVNLAESIVSQIEKCILATKQSIGPRTLQEQILCDADLYHLGTEEFCITNELVKKEIELRCNTTLENWDASSLRFLQNHVYHTSYCKELLTAGKLENIAFLQKRVANIQP
ncbi:MAG: hypothetical protein ABIN01_09195 [Ferruginibacter sp.]